MMTYLDGLKRVAGSQTRGWDKAYSDSVFSSLNHGTAIIDSADQATQYLWAFSAMHQAKLTHAFAQIKDVQSLQNAHIDVVDYGAGQAIASMAWLNFLQQNVANCSVDHIHLIDASATALKLAASYLTLPSLNFSVSTALKNINQLRSSDLLNNSDNIRVHLFSNILDIDTFDLHNLYKKVADNLSSINYFVCVGPKNIGMRRNRQFADFFSNDFKVLDRAYIDADRLRKTNYGSPWTAYGVVFKVVV